MVGFAATAVVIPASDAAGAWHVPACMGSTSSGVNTGANASIMSVSIGMVGMLVGCKPCEWVAGRCTSSMIVSVNASSVGMSDRTSPVSDWPPTTSPASLWYESNDSRGACMWLLAGAWLCGRMPHGRLAACRRARTLPRRRSCGVCPVYQAGARCS